MTIRQAPILHGKTGIARVATGTMSNTLLVSATIQPAIRRFRGQNVMLDSELAALYQVDVRVLNQAVSRHGERFPLDFMFRLTAPEAESLRSQIVILKRSRGRHRKYLPIVFTEQGVAMLSTVLRSPRAIAVNIEIMRSFVDLRRMLGSNADLTRKLDALEQKSDARFKVVFEAIRKLMAPPTPRQRRIGFRVPS